MNPSTSPAGRARIALGWVAAWVMLGLYFASQSLLYARYSGRAPDLRFAVAFPVIEMVLWSMLSPAVVALARRVPFARGRNVRALAVHLPVALVTSAVETLVAGAIFFGLGFFAESQTPPLRLLGGLAIGKVNNNLLIYAAVVGITHMLDLWRRYRDREIAASRLEARLADARLDVLRMQLQPHFLFNTLHAISSLMHRDPEAADRMLTRLSDLLRLSMEQDDARDVPLAREIEFLDGYLEIQRTRFGARLKSSVTVEPEALNARVPSLLLQPLVENAIRHGIGDRASGGTVEVSARVRGNTLEIEVLDDGLGIRPGGRNGGAPGGGRGLANTRARLEHLYGARQSFELAARSGGGAIARIVVPLADTGLAEDEPT